MKSAIVTAITGIGIFLFLLSAMWSTIFPPTSRWTNEKANRFHDVKAKLHNLSFVVDAPKPNLQRGQDLGQMKAEYNQLLKEKAELDAEYTSVADTPKTVAKFLKWSGLSLAIVGIIGWYAVSQSR
jgi:hypothetical protein